MHDVLSKWADPQLWFVFGLPALLLVGFVVLSAAAIGTVVWVVWCFLKPKLDKAFEVHVSFLESSMENDRKRTADLSHLSSAVVAIKPELAAHTAALSHGARALANLPLDEKSKAAVDHHVSEMEDALRPHVIRCQPD